jgi:hypothetical protein
MFVVFRGRFYLRTWCSSQVEGLRTNIQINMFFSDNILNVLPMIMYEIVALSGPKYLVFKRPNS